MQQPIGRVSHVELVYPLDQLDAVCARLSEVLGIAEWDRFEMAPPYNAAVAVNLEAGIEIVAPLTDDHPFAEYIRQRGPGVRTFTFGVADLDEGIGRAAESGVGLAMPAWDMVERGEGRLHEEFAVLREANLERFADLDLRLAQIEPR